MKQNYLYHKVPKNFTGNILYPLNQLKDIYPDLYEFQASKYAGREHVMEHKIPPLDCLWNDVLQFGAVHPKEIFDELKKYDDKKIAPKYFKIPAELLEKEKTAVYLYEHKIIDGKLNTKDFVEFDPSDVEKYSIMPQATKDYYKKSYNNNQKPLLWHKIPHILYKGTIDVDGVEVVGVD